MRNSRRIGDNSRLLDRFGYLIVSPMGKKLMMSPTESEEGTT